MATIEKSASATVNASAGQVWRILADEFVDISHWAGGVKSSKPNPEVGPFNGSAVGGRVCDVDGVGLTDERIVAFDPDGGVIGYSVTAEGLPSFVASLKSTWTVTPAGPNTSEVDMRIDATTKGLMGAVGSIPMGRMLGKSAPGLLNDLKTYAERSGS
jgi:hypothetical protein